MNTSSLSGTISIGLGLKREVYMGLAMHYRNEIILQRLFFVIPVKTGIQDVYGLQKLNWIPASAGMTDMAVALFAGTVPFFLKESL